MSEQKQARAEVIAQAAKDPDWGQVVANGGPPCFHVEDGRFCLRAKRWGGHDEMHRYMDLAAALESFVREERKRILAIVRSYNGANWRRDIAARIREGK